MLIVGMHEAKTHLSHLIKEAELHGSFQISRNGQPVVEVRPLTGTFMKKRPLGRLRGEASIPDDFDTMGQKEINKLFYGE